MEKSKRRKEDDAFTLSSIDRVSELPLPILNHILSFLPQNQAAQTCVLSKSWYNVWCTSPNIVFSQPPFVSFLSIIDGTLQRYHRQNLSIKRFVVKMSLLVDYELISVLEKWIPIVLMNLGVQTFHLSFPHPYVFNSHKSRYYYALPSAPVIFGAEFLKELYLSGVRISDDKHQQQQLCLKHLKTLSLNNVFIEDEALAKIMASCPLVECVDLYRCYGLTAVDCMFSGHKSALETIKISFCPSLCLSNSNAHDFLHLKSLHLSNIKLPKKLSGSFSCNYPFLEDLELRSCNGLIDVEVLSCSVKRLIIANMLNQIKTVTIDAPHILYFEFSCNPTSCPLSLPSVSFATVATASKECESSVSVPFVVSRCDIDIKLNQMLKALRQSRITLILDYLWSQRFKDKKYAGWGEPLVVEHLKLRRFESPDHPHDDFAALFNCLFKIFRPRYIYVRMHPYKYYASHLKLAEFISKTNLKDGDFSRCYFWQQELKEINLEILDHDSSQWRRSNLTVYALEKNQVMENIRFGFEWRDRVLVA